MKIKPKENGQVPLAEAVKKILEKQGVEIYFRGYKQVIIDLDITLEFERKS